MGSKPVIIDPFTPAIITYFAKLDLRLDEGISSSTEQQVRVYLRDGILSGRSEPQIAASIQGILSNFNIERVSRLVQRELTRASTYADIEVWAASGVVKGKEWLTARDNHVCFDCQSIDSSIYDLKNEIRDGQQGPPLHDGCRCVLLPIRS